MNPLRTACALAAVAAALAGASPARADDVSDFLQKAKESSDVAVPASRSASDGACSDGLATATAAKFCRSVPDCRKFCACACQFDPHKWKADVKNDGSTTCPGAPQTGTGMLPPDAPELSTLPAYGYLTHAPGEKAAAPALEGLKRLDDYLAASPDRARLGFTVRVVSCYRSHLEDTEPECGYVMKAAYMLSRVSDPKQRAYWEQKSDPNNLGLAWPGSTPHSGGYACDLILVDSRGQDSFDSRAGVDGAPTSSIGARLASKMLDEAVTASGGSRLTFEAWHYEWGAAGAASRCQDPECAEKHWPVPGVPPSR